MLVPFIYTLSRIYFPLNFSLSFRRNQEFFPFSISMNLTCDIISKFWLTFKFDLIAQLNENLLIKMILRIVIILLVLTKILIVILVLNIWKIYKLNYVDLKVIKFCFHFSRIRRKLHFKISSWHLSFSLHYLSSLVIHQNYRKIHLFSTLQIFLNTINQLYFELHFDLVCEIYLN